MGSASDNFRVLLRVMSVRLNWVRVDFLHVNEQFEQLNDQLERERGVPDLVSVYGCAISGAVVVYRKRVVAVKRRYRNRKKVLNRTAESLLIN